MTMEDFRAVVRSAPDTYLLLLAPDFIIVEVSDAITSGT